MPMASEIQQTDLGDLALKQPEAVFLHALPTTAGNRKDDQ
jgi:hypothetical protein